MKIKHLTNTGSSRLLLFFAGWGMDENPFSSFRPTDCDFAVAYDYSVSTDAPLHSGHTEIMIVAWSFGVIAADLFISRHPELPITARIAVNGTLHPVDDRLGIPTAIFERTLAGLTEQSLSRFNRRMCGGAKAAETFNASRPNRSLDSLRNELIAIAAMQNAGSAWDKAYISLNDNIIPPDNQKTAWALANVDTIEIDAPHLPDLRSIFEREIIDKKLVAQRFSNAVETYDDNAGIQRTIASELSERWRALCPSETIDSLIEIGAGTGLLTDSLCQWLTPRNLQLWDISQISERLPGRHHICDGETAIRKLSPETVDAIATASAMQWFCSPRSFIASCYKALKKGGWLAIATYGPDNFKEIRKPPYPSLSKLTQWIGNDMEILYADEQRIARQFNSPKELLTHIRLTGVNAVSQDSKTITEARRIITRDLRTLTYHPIIIIARKR